MNPPKNKKPTYQNSWRWVRFNLGLERSYKAVSEAEQDAAAVTVGCGQQQTPVIRAKVIRKIRVTGSSWRYKSFF
jgi:hypothetical protein